MDDETNGHLYPHLPSSLGSISGHSIQVDIVTTPTSDAGSPPVEGGRTDFWPPDVVPYAYDPKIKREAYPVPFYPPIQPTLYSGTCEKSGTLLPENPIAGIRDDGLPVVREGPLSLHGRSDLTYESDFTPYAQPKSTVQEGFIPASGIRTGDFSNDTHPYPRVETASKLLVPPTLPLPTQCREEKVSRDRPHQTLKARKKSMPESSWPSRRLADMLKAPKRPFSCGTCGERFAQPQGVTRHDREKHNPSLCMYCDVEWSRPYQYRKHLEKYHTGVDPDTVLGKTAGSRRRTAIITRHPPQEQVLSPTKHDGRGRSKIRPYLPTLPLAKPPTPTPPAMLSMTYVPQPEFAQTTTRKSHPEEATPNNLDNSTRCEKIWLWSASQSGCAGRPSNPVTALIPTLAPPACRYHGSREICRNTFAAEEQIPRRH